MDMIIGIIVILILTIAGAYIGSWWLSRRIRELMQLAKEYNLQFSTNLPKYLGFYFSMLTFGKVNIVSGALGAHQVEVYDWYITDQNVANPLEWRTNALAKGRSRGTAINLDGQPMHFGPTNLTLGGSSMFARISEIKDVLEKIKNNNL